MLPDSPKDVWPRLGCVTSTLLASGRLETGAASQCLYKLSLQWSSHSVLHMASKPPVSLAFLAITAIDCQSFPYMLPCLNCRSPPNYSHSPSVTVHTETPMLTGGILLLEELNHHLE